MYTHDVPQVSFAMRYGVPVVTTEKGPRPSPVLSRARPWKQFADLARCRCNRRQDPRAMLPPSISVHNKAGRRRGNVKIERSRGEIYAWRTILMNDEISRRHRSSRQRLSERARPRNQTRHPRIICHGTGNNSETVPRPPREPSAAVVGLNQQ